MRSKKTRELRKGSIKIMPKSILNTPADYGRGLYTASNPYKNFIRNERKASWSPAPVSKKGYAKMMKVFNREQRKLKNRRKAA